MMMMGGSGGSMGMDMMNMGSNMGMNNMNNMSNMGNMGNMGNMSGMGGMQGGVQWGMQMDPNAMGSMNHGAMQGMVNSNAMGNGGLFGNGGFGLNSLLSGILNLAIDIFAILLVVGLVVGAAVLIKKYLFESDLLAPKAKVACVNCGQVLNADWACCPKCGQAKVVPQPVAANPQTV